MEDKQADVTKLKKDSDALKNILGDDSEASGVIDGQVTEFNTFWNDLAEDIQSRIQKVIHTTVHIEDL